MTETKTCQNCKQSFTIEPEDFNFYKKIDVPAPTFCSDCRMQRRMLWRNERILHRRKSSLSGKDLISQYPKETSFPVYGVREFYSRDWDPPSLKYDSNRSFLAQFQSLLLKTPRCALLTDIQSLDNGSIYQNSASRNKNCYMVSASGDNEDCLYSNNLDYAKNSIDCLWCRRVEHAYECVDSIDCARTFFCDECRQCVDSWFLYNCRNCLNCFGCVGLRSKSYCLWNKQLTKEEYESQVGKILESLILERVLEFQSKLKNMALAFPRKYAHIDPKSAPTCTGDYIIDSQNVFQGFTVHESQNVRYCSKLIAGKECLDVNDWGDPAELCYESITVGKGAYKVFFSSNCWPECRELQYCESCSSSHHLFGCVGLKNASYCILNKQYTEEEYNRIVPEIIDEMKRRKEYGEFFPKEFSPFPYNESIAQENFPLTRKEAVEKGFIWRESDRRDYEITMKTMDISRSIKQVDDSMLREIIGCVHGGKCNHECATAFKIVSEELKFYRRFGLPLPQLCFNCRHAARFNLRNLPKVWKDSCKCAGKKSENGIYQNTTEHFHEAGKCPNEFETSYSPDKKEIVYCGQCYNAEII